MFNKRAQSALEFLTTYGWAFLVILIMIGALAYFGVLDPSRFLPDKCVSTAGFSCGESTAQVATNTIRAQLTNGGGQDLTFSTFNLLNVTVSGSQACTSITDLDIETVDAVATAVTWRSGQTQEVVGTCNGAIAAGERVEFNIRGAYVPSGSTYPKAFDLTVSTRAQ